MNLKMFHCFTMIFSSNCANFNHSSNIKHRPLSWRRKSRFLFRTLINQILQSVTFLIEIGKILKTLFYFKKMKPLKFKKLLFLWWCNANNNVQLNSLIKWWFGFDSSGKTKLDKTISIVINAFSLDTTVLEKIANCLQLLHCRDI